MWFLENSILFNNYNKNIFQVNDLLSYLIDKPIEILTWIDKILISTLNDDELEHDFHDFMGINIDSINVDQECT